MFMKTDMHLEAAQLCEITPEKDIALYALAQPQDELLAHLPWQGCCPECGSIMTAMHASLLVMSHGMHG